MKYNLLLSLLFGILLIGLVSSASNNQYSDCSVYGTCNTAKSSITGNGSVGPQGPQGIPGTNGTNLFTSINQTQFDNSTGVLNIIPSWLINFINSLTSGFLLKSGDTMSGNLNMSNNNITTIKKTSYTNSSYGIWSNSTDVVIGYIGGL